MAAGVTYEPIATTTLNTDTSTIAFTSISGSYTDLVMVISTQLSAASNAYIKLQFNGNTAANYSVVRLYGNGSSAITDSFTNTSDIDTGFMPGADGTGKGLIIANIMNYSNTTTFKTCLIKWNSVAAASTKQYTVSEIGQWRSTSAINRIDLTANSGNFNSGTTVTLYGIAAA